MFEAITDSIRGALSLIDRGRLTESNIREGLLQVRKALLEADVNYEVAQDFINRVTEQAVGEQVLKSLRPERTDRRHRLSGTRQPDGARRSLAADQAGRHLAS